jgi:hypothetical protein
MVLEKSKDIFCVQYPFPKIRAVYEIMLKNMVEADRT